MKPLDLWKIYKTVYARFRYVMSIDTKSEQTRLKARKMESAALKIIEAAERREDAPSILRLINQFEKVEARYRNAPDVRTSAPPAAKAFEDAVKSGNYVSGRPHQISHEPARGIVYCACAKSRTRRGQIKIGHTTLPLEKRLQLFRSKYGYEIGPLFSAEVDKPARVEREVQLRLKPFRVSGSTNGDSNEWYRIDRASAVRAVKTAIRKLGSNDIREGRRAK